MSDWTKNKLKDLVVINYGKSPKDILSIEGVIPVVGTGGIERYGQSYLYEGESIVLGRKGTIDNPLYINGKFWAIDTTYFLADFNEINVKWLYYFLKTVDFRAMNEATGVPSLARDYLYSIEVNTPSEKEQAAIAKVLGKIDLAIEKTKKLIEKQKRIRQGLVQDLLTKGIDELGKVRNEGTHRFKDSVLGRIPEEWEIKLLSDLVFANRPIVYGILMPGNNFDNGVPVIKVKDIKNGKVDSENLLLTDPKIDNQYQRSKTKTNDLLLTIRGTVGRTAFVPKNLEGANITQDTARISIEKGVPSFIRAYLEMPASKLFIDIHTLGVAVQGINLGDVRRIPIAFPSINEQKVISEKLDLFERRITKEINYLAKLNLIKTGLMQDLLSGKKSVENSISE
jgi:type I restriction enzyme, S subunit